MKLLMGAGGDLSRKRILFFGLFIIGLVIFLIFLLGLIGDDKSVTGAMVNGGVVEEKLSESDFDCVSSDSVYTLRGSSLEPLLTSGDSVRGLLGYYDCNPVVRGDIVMLNFLWREMPVIKIVKGLPGDSISLLSSEGGSNIVINDEILLNSVGEPYLIEGGKEGMIGLYVKDYGGVIPESAYLVLGDNPSGTVDSTQIGLLDRSYFIGKMIVIG